MKAILKCPGHCCASDRKLAVCFDDTPPEVHEADDWDRSCVPITAKLTYRDMLELRQLELDLLPNNPNSPAPSYGRGTIPIGFMPLNPVTSSAPTPAPTPQPTPPTTAPPSPPLLPQTAPKSFAFLPLLPTPSPPPPTEMWTPPTPSPKRPSLPILPVVPDVTTDDITYTSMPGAPKSPRDLLPPSPILAPFSLPAKQVRGPPHAQVRSRSRSRSRSPSLRHSPHSPPPSPKTSAAFSMLPPPLKLPPSCVDMPLTPAQTPVATESPASKNFDDWLPPSPVFAPFYLGD